MGFDYLFKETSTIKEAQVVQQEIDKITIRYIPRENFQVYELEKIKKIISTYIIKLLEINFDEVKTIERTKNGKFKAVVSEIL